LLTTYGVGELSAINRIVGAYAEYLPLIHYYRCAFHQRAGALIHHPLGDGDFEQFPRAQAEVTVTQAYLTTGNAATEIASVLSTSLRERRPGYLVLPTDVAASSIDRPAGPLAVAAARVLEDFVVEARTMLAEAGSLTVLADFLADRLGVRRKLANLVTAGGIRHATLSMGKSMFDGSDPNSVGVYSRISGEESVLVRGAGQWS
jgi:indolepyruvate decarboxylase